MLYNPKKASKAEWDDDYIKYLQTKIVCDGCEEGDVNREKKVLGKRQRRKTMILWRRDGSSKGNFDET